MAGFPRIPTRAAFGPTFENVRPVRDPRTELDAATMNLLAWQVAGASQTIPLALLVMQPAPPNLGISLHFEAWATAQDGAPPVLEYLGIGSYRVTYPVTAPDENGTAIAFAPRACMAFAQGSLVVVAFAAISAGVITITVQNGVGVPTDSAVLLMVW